MGGTVGSPAAVEAMTEALGPPAVGGLAQAVSRSANVSAKDTGPPARTSRSGRLAAGISPAPGGLTPVAGLFSPQPSVTLLRSTPMPSISISTTSPFFMKIGGLRAKPTPCGVPVGMRSPGSSVVKPEQ